jgi:hypothetical protein
MFGEAEKAGQRLTRLAMKRVGIDDDHIAFAVRIGLVPARAQDSATRLEKDRNKTRRVKNWVEGGNAPDFEGTMTMLSETGLLQPEAEAAWRGISLADAVLRVEALRDQVELQEASSPLDVDGGRLQDERKLA